MPASGEALISTPNSGYIRWISGCVSSYLNSLVNFQIKDVSILSAKSKKYFIEKQLSEDPKFYTIWQPFHELPEEIQEDLINYSFYVVFGPDENFNQFGLLEAQEFRRSLREHLLKTSIDTRKSLEIIFLNYLTRDEFLSY